MASNLRTSHFRFNFAILATIFLLFFSATCVVAAPTSSTSSSASSSTSTLDLESPRKSNSTSNSNSTSSSTSPKSDEPKSSGPVHIELPKAFDTNIPSNNFSSYTCYPFFTSFLQNQTFVDCLPLSFFVQNSKSWFNIVKDGEVAITQALDASCGVDVNKCSAVMNDLARQLLSPNNCGTEFKNRDPVVTAAYAAFLTYGVNYSAGCLKDKKTGGYCYSQAAGNAKNPADAYIYFVPSGVPLPGGSRLTCSPCLQQTMMIYASSAGNNSLPLYDTYTPSAQIIDMGCGPQFVNTTASSQSASTSLYTTLESSLLLSSVTLITSIAILIGFV